VSAGVQDQMIEVASNALVKVLTAPPKQGAGKPATPPMTLAFKAKVLGATGPKFLASTVGKEVASEALTILIPAFLLGIGASYMLYRKKA
jgi:hypothetical protein